MHTIKRLPAAAPMLLAFAAMNSALLLWWRVLPPPLLGNMDSHRAMNANPALLRTFITANLLTGLSYITISATLAYLVYRARRAIPFHWVVLAFGIFILAFGSGHLIDVLVIWRPNYLLESAIHTLTAVASMTTAVILPSLVPLALQLIGDARHSNEHKLQLERVNADLQLEVAERQRLGEELRQQRDLYERLLQGLSDLGECVIFGEGDRFLFVNDAFCRLSGYSRDELLRELTPLALAAPEHSVAAASHLAQLQNGTDTGSFEGLLRHRLGHSIPLEVSSKVIASSGRSQFLSVMRDSTARSEAAQALEASQARLAGILDTADDAIIVLDEKQTITLFNQGAERIFGYQAEDVLEQPIDRLLPEAVHERHRRHIEDFSVAAETARRMGERQQIHGRRADGAEFPAEASIAKLLLNGQTIFTVILRDITKRKLAEQQLRTSLAEKEVLLKEVHHRVKNNLQVIVSLLRLQVNSLADPAVGEPLRDCQ
ncbi:MAG TPA: PAS domain S-box protein, partial [Roseiflexaceae bacterium]|nr:PAS domain S-box protein [Roseiflexaceae bacterium]